MAIIAAQAESNNVQISLICKSPAVADFWDSHDGLAAVSAKIRHSNSRLIRFARYTHAVRTHLSPTATVILFSMDLYPLALAYRFARFLRVSKRAVVLDVHDHPRSWRSRLLLSATSRAADRSIAISQFIASAMPTAAVSIVRRPIVDVGTSAIRDSRSDTDFVIGVVGRVDPPLRRLSLQSTPFKLSLIPAAYQSAGRNLWTMVHMPRNF